MISTAPSGSVETIERSAERAARGVDEQRTQTLAAAEHRVAHRAMQLDRRLILGWKHAREHFVGASGEGLEIGREFVHGFGAGKD